MNPLVQIPNDLKAFLLGSPALSVVPIDTFRQMSAFGMNEKDLLSPAEQYQKSLVALKPRVPNQRGTHICIFMPSVVARFPNVPNSQKRLEIIVGSFEHLIFNNTGRTAEDNALAVESWIGDGLQIEGYTTLYAPEGERSIEPDTTWPGYRVVHVRLTGELPRDAGDLGDRVIAPDISEAAGTITLSCADAGAQIYFTTDGNCPQPGLPAQLYTVPFPVAVGTVIRALAWKDNARPSDIIKATRNS